MNCYEGVLASCGLFFVYGIFAEFGCTSVLNIDKDSVNALDVLCFIQAY